MKRMLVLVAVAVVLSGCARPSAQVALPPWATARPAPAQMVDANGAPIQRIPFTTGVSSATVEKMAKAQSCTGGMGAGLVTPAGPVEVYRMRCDNGKTFMARCELRQCRQM